MRTIIFIFLSANIFANVPTYENRNYFPLGEKELFSGNTGTGGIGSSAAVYFNPAALTQIKQNKLSVTASSFYYFSFKMDPQDYVDNQALNYESTSFNSVPSSIISVYQFKEYTAAFAIMSPFSYALENQMEWRTSLQTIYFEEKQEGSDLWVALSLARKFENGWSAGLTLMAMKHYELLIDHMIQDYHSQTQGNANLSRTQIDVWNLTGVLGVLKEGDFISYGIRLHSPSLKIMGSGDYFKTEQSYQSSLSESTMNKVGVDANYEVPADIGVGVNIHLLPTLNILADVSYQFAGSFRTFEDREILASDENGNRKVKGMYRANVGLQFEPSDKIEFLTGAYYVPSASDVSSQKSSFRGATVGGYYSIEQTKSGAGLFVVQMRGDGSVTNYSGRSDIQLNIYGAVLSTSYFF